MQHIKRELVGANLNVLCACGRPASVKWEVETIVAGIRVQNYPGIPDVTSFCIPCHKKEVDTVNELYYPHFMSEKLMYNLDVDNLLKKNPVMRWLKKLMCRVSWC